MGDAIPDPTVKLELEVGDVEIEFEGPASFAREDLARVVHALMESVALSGVDFDDEDFDEDDREDEHADAGAKPETSMEDVRTVVD